MMYVVKKVIWHTGDKVYYFPCRPGEPDVVVSLDHLKLVVREKMVRQGVFAEVVGDEDDEVEVEGDVTVPKE